MSKRMLISVEGLVFGFVGGACGLWAGWVLSVAPQVLPLVFTTALVVSGVVLAVFSVRLTYLAAQTARRAYRACSREGT